MSPIEKVLTYLLFAEKVRLLTLMSDDPGLLLTLEILGIYTILQEDSHPHVSNLLLLLLANLGL